MSYTTKIEKDHIIINYKEHEYRFAASGLHKEGDEPIDGAIYIDEELFSGTLNANKQVCIGCNTCEVTSGGHTFFNCTVRYHEDIGIKEKDNFLYCIIINSFIAHHEFNEKNKFVGGILMDTKMHKGCILDKVKCIVGGRIVIASGEFKDDTDFQFYIHGL